MRLERLLIHTCTLINPGQVIGKDPYNRDIVQDVPIEGVSCRVDQIKRRISNDTHGTDIIVENVLFLSPAQKINDSMKIANLRDKTGNPVLLGIFKPANINPVFARRGLHHYEITLKKESDQVG